MYKKLYSILLISIIIGLSSACSNHASPYPEREPTKVLRPADLTAEELAYHEKYMQYTVDLALANKAIFSAIIVHNNGTIVCEGINMGFKMKDNTQHAEIVVMQNCSKLYSIQNYANYSLYTTGESCVMCQAAIMWNYFSKVIYGTSIKTLYCEKCMGQVLIDSNVINAYGVGLSDDYAPVQIYGDILANVTNTKVFLDYCTNKKVWTVTPNCTAPSSSSSSNSGSTITMNVLINALIALVAIIGFSSLL
ncbi:hypothetical protein CYY_004658 [Polysphondylium violaceum]|uniref:CMP/dCMP-type deaminase domain-containing protein n=1 Tax=Polysphondylium violaceum TaxID=133409 RepID=A0A8J4PWJ7_9MYCE|nr:hypothetical protein CYY_004658 [Polysphondylium violaceum]